MAVSEEQKVRIRRLAGIGAWSCYIALVFAIGPIVLALLSLELRDAILFSEYQVNNTLWPNDPKLRSYLFYLSIPNALCASFAVFMAARLFVGFKRGEIFTKHAGWRFELIGWSVFTLAPMHLIMKGIIVTAFPGSQGTGFSLTVLDFDFTVAALGLLAILIGRILGEAAKLAEENDSFI